MVTEEFVRADFASWETDDPSPYFTNMPENVNWIVTGKDHPLAGHYKSKTEAIAVFSRILSKLATPLECKLVNVMASGDWGIVEMTGHATTTGGNSYDQECVWLCRYEGDKCAEVRFYTDTLAYQKLFDEP